MKCYTDSMRLSKDLGTRHRAAVGVSEKNDSLTIIVSEETGKVSVAYAGEIYRGIQQEELAKKLKELQHRKPESSRLLLLKRRLKSDKKNSTNSDK